MADYKEDVLTKTEGHGHSSTDGEAPVAAPLSRHGAVNESKLLRKIDWHVLPILFCVYLVAFLDRVNISNALTMGLPQQLGLTGQQPNIALTIFFVPYILFEIPSNIILKKLSPRIWLSGSVVTFGIIMIGQAFVRSYGALLATRFLLGLAEAGVFPGSFYLISFWYRKDEAQKRFTVYWSSTLCAGAFGSLLATGIANMNGISGLENWRWIFLLEGLVTIVVGVAAYFLIADFPKEAAWLTEDERDLVLSKTGSDESHDVPITGRDVLEVIKKPKNWFGAVMYFSLLVSLYSLAYFTPTIVQSLQLDVVQTQLHSVPPFAAAFGFAMIVAFASDKIGLRSPFIFLGLIMLIAGLAILTTVQSGFSARYAGLNLTAMGSLGIGANVVCWYVMNLQGHAERSIGTAWMICIGNLGGIVATFAFQRADAPFYRTGYSICIAMAALCVVSSACYGLMIRREMRAAGGRGKGYLL